MRLRTCFKIMAIEIDFKLLPRGMECFSDKNFEIEPNEKGNMQPSEQAGDQKRKKM